MYLTRKLIMLLRKYLLVTESQVSKCGFLIGKKKGDVLYPKRTKYSKYRKGRCSRSCKTDGTQLGFGRYGTKSCKAGRLSYRAIEAARRAIIGQFHRMIMTEKSHVIIQIFHLITIQEYEISSNIIS
ncbi:unnamed protein product [Linum tenue]|uniref:Ribosomal protein L16 n=1 Tax=Linum tenue TaxID=586396 RepID=A0AAV0P6T4_9ROSI|nr:unnamed protein product [Linum tenue]